MDTKIDAAKVMEIFQYMSLGFVHALDSRIQPADGALVFCREDPGIAEATATLFRRGRIAWAVLTGGVGKDSGKLTVPEAVHQQNLLQGMGIPPDTLHLEPTARNGAENFRFGIDTIIRENLSHDQIILVVHPHNARRVYATHTHIAREEKGFKAQYQVVCMHTDVHPSDPATQRELLSELLRVEDWPEKGWSDRQDDLPQELVDWARSALASFPT